MIDSLLKVIRFVQNQLYLDYLNFEISGTGDGHTISNLQKKNG